MLEPTRSLSFIVAASAGEGVLLAMFTYMLAKILAPKIMKLINKPEGHVIKFKNGGFIYCLQTKEKDEVTKDSSRAR